MKTSLQDQYGPKGICFGCGPSNPKGLQIKSHVEGDEIVAEWTSQPHHQAFEGALNGGIIGALLDCHSNWTTAYTLMKRNSLTEPPGTVTADYHVMLKRPTPAMKALKIRAKAVEVSEDRATIEATLEADGKICATCRGTFVAVKPGHPAYHRWGN